MLVIGPPAPADYYATGSPGRWTGGGARGLGLDGPAGAEDLGRVLAGRDGRGAYLWPSAARRRRLGHDLVFAAPKALSLIWALAGRDASQAVAAAHEASVTDALDYLERTAAWARRGSAGQLVPITGFVAASFRHSLSRAGDPHLHSHVVVANAACDRSGQWSSLDGRWLFAERRTASALYQAGLRHHTAANGLALHWRVTAGGLSLADEVSEDIVAAFSWRRRQILARGGGGRMANLLTRPRPPDVPGPAGWGRRAQEAGFDGAAFRVHPPTAGAVEAVSGAATELRGRHLDDLLGVDGVTSASALFTRSELIRAIASRSPAGARADAIEAEADRILASPAVIEVTSPVTGAVRPRVAPRYTTPELAALDDGLVAAAASARALAEATIRRVRPDGDRADLGVLDRRPLSPEDRHAVAALARFAGPVAVVRGPPGPSGRLARAAVMEAARAVWEEAGRPVVGIAATEADRFELEAATGIVALVAGELGRSGVPPGLAPGSVVVVADAARLAHRTLARLLPAVAARGGQVILVDGTRRPAALEGRDLLSRLHRAGVGLDIVGRPGPDPPGGPVRLGHIDGPAGTVTFCADPASQRQALVDDWARAGPGRTVMVARDQAERDDLNRRARESLAARGRLDGPRVTAGGRDYVAGEPVAVRRSSPRLGLTRGRAGTVVSVDAQHGRLTIRWDNARRPVVVRGAEVGPSVLAHAYAVAPRRDAPRGGPVVLALGALGALGAHGGPGRPRHHYVVAGEPPPPGRQGHDRLTRLAGERSRADAEQRATLSRRTTVLTEQPMERLHAERSSLADRLGRALPPEVQAQLDKARERQAAARHWAGTREPGRPEPGRPKSGRSERAAAADEAVGRLEADLARLETWLTERSGDLLELAALDGALARRAHLLARTDELLAGPERRAGLARAPLLSPERSPAEHHRDAGLGLP